MFSQATELTACSIFQRSVLSFKSVQLWHTCHLASNKCRTHLNSRDVTRGNVHTETDRIGLLAHDTTEPWGGAEVNQAAFPFPLHFPPAPSQLCLLFVLPSILPMQSICLRGPGKKLLVAPEKKPLAGVMWVTYPPSVKHCC